MPEEGTAGRGATRREVLAGGVALALSERTRMKHRNDQAWEVLAYYFPNYHPDARNDQWHGKGWTEWELVKAARPRFPGHRQPLEPSWGFFDESDPRWAAREIDLAADHGITGFLYDWYWYEDGPCLLDGLERGFLNAPNRRRLKFALMWANHDWLNIHPAKFTNRPETLAPGRVSRAAFDRIADHVVSRYFTQANYLRIGGRPYFSIYEMGTLVAGLGGMDAARDALDSLREKARRAGHGGIHLNAVAWGLTMQVPGCQLPPPAERVRRLGVDSVTSYAWVHHADPGEAGFPKGSCGRAAQRNYQAWEELARLPAAYHPNVSMGWDPSPRTVQSDVYESRGYPWTSILHDASPEQFREALERARAFAQNAGHRVVTLNAWNEWTEGSYLLPERARGTAWLEAVRAVFGRRSGREE